MRIVESIWKGGSVWRIWRFAREGYGLGTVCSVVGRRNLLLLVIWTVMSENVAVVLCWLG